MMKYFLDGNNYGLAIKKRFSGKKYRHFFVVNALCDINFLQGQTYIFPLYLDGDNNGSNPFSSRQQSFVEPYQPNLSSVIGGRKTNISNKFLSHLKNVYGESLNPEDIFAYVYSVLNSNLYGSKYLNQLANDFPRIPFTSNYDLFKSLAKRGKELISLHLLKSEFLDNPVAKFYGKNSELVKSKAIYKEGKLYINDSQYFEKVEKEVWEFQVGGYQVLDKWFKDRISKHLDENNIRIVCKIITAITKTFEIQKQIDSLYPEVEKGFDN